jgi:hypothetical protein
LPLARDGQSLRGHELRARLVEQFAMARLAGGDLVEIAAAIESERRRHERREPV